MSDCVRIHRFDPTTITNDSIVLFLGSRGQGKTTTMKRFLYDNRHRIRTVVCFSATAGVEANSAFKHMFPDTFMYEEYKPAVVKRVVDYCRITDYCGGVCFVLEDVMNDATEIRKDPAMKYIAFNGRHNKFWIFITMQFAHTLKPEMRSQFDYIVLTKISNHQDRERIYKSLAGCIPSFKMFCKLLDSFTDNHGVLFISNRSESTRLEDSVFFFRAPKELPRFELGSKKLWNYHRTHYDENYIQRKLEELKRRLHVNRDRPQQEKPEKIDNGENEERPPATKKRRAKGKKVLTMQEAECDPNSRVIYL